MEEKAFRLRMANQTDALFLFDLKNDPLTRATAGNDKQVSWEEHQQWLAKNDPNRIITIAEVDRSPVGTVRSDKEADGYHRISYIVSPDHRGEGYGSIMVQAFAKKYLRGAPVRAFIQQGNTASERIAKKIGLQPFSNDLLREWRN